MRKWITLLIVLLIAWMAGATWYWLCQVQNLCCESAHQATTSEVADDEIASNATAENPMAEGSASGDNDDSDDKATASTTDATNMSSEAADDEALTTMQADVVTENNDNDSAVAANGANNQRGEIDFTSIGLESFYVNYDAQGLPANDAEMGRQLDALAAAILAKQAEQPSDVAITGFFAANDANNTAAANLGLARAGWLADQLTARGVSASSMLLLYGTHSSPASGASPDTSDADEIAEPELPMLGIQVELMPHVQRKSAGTTSEPGGPGTDVTDGAFAIPANLIDPVVVRFGLNQSFFDLSSDQRRALLQRIQYLRAHPELALEATGHTDSSGNRGSNLQLGLNRADNVASTLASFGIDRTRIHTRSEGPDSPVADNVTATGQALNRRVEITLIPAK